MFRPLEAHVEAAKRLLAQERGSGGHAEERAAAAAVRVYELLFQSLAPVIGESGVRALFARSVRLASAESPCLGESPMTVDPPESVHGVQHLVGCLSKLEPAAGAEVSTAVFAYFLGLLTKFIGERLVLQVVKTAFPAMGEADTGPKEME